MEPKKIILCPNPDRDTGMKATKSATVSYTHLTLPTT